MTKITLSLFSLSVPRSIPQLGTFSAPQTLCLMGPSFQLEQSGSRPSLLFLISLCKSHLHPYYFKALLWLRSRWSWRVGRWKPSDPWAPGILVTALSPPLCPSRWGGVSPLTSCCSFQLTSSPPSYASKLLCASERPQGFITGAASPAPGPRTSTCCSAHT